MDTLPLHPKLVHLPIALAVLMPLITMVVLVAWWRGRLPRVAWWGVVGLQAVLLATGLYARETGEEDEERVEAVVPEAAIEAHEDAATGFVIGAGVALALAVAAGVVRPRGPALAVAGAAALGTMVVLGLGYRVGQAGGELVYRYGAAAAWAAPTTGSGPGAPGVAAPRDRDDDDD
ncbi:MAG: hypothetical protein IPL61_06335 [Myxococcales bacterium]|nr:hypothetical protein [Myxococcales bacterium]